MPWKEVTQVSERLNFCMLAEEGKYSISELARSFGISRKTAYKWIGRYKEQGETGVFDLSRRPKRSPSCFDQDVVDEVVKLKSEYPMWGPRKLHALLVKRIGDSACSRTTVGRILARHGLCVPHQNKPMQEAVDRFERGRANELWQTDFTAPFVMENGRKVFAVPILDDNSRYCVGLSAAPACSAESVLECFRSAAMGYGLPEQVLSDHGGAFGTSRSYVSEFTAYMWALEVEHIQGRYAHPQTQGKLERFNQTLRRECISRHCYTSFDDWNKCFEEYRHLYNEVRPHESLCDCVPASRYSPSQRRFQEPDKDYREHSENLIHRRVDSSGKIWLLQHHVKIGSGLAGWTVSARHDGQGIWTIMFRSHSICQVSLAKTAQYKPRP